ncbi:hypothetical protein HC766_04295 [Candidatus Gracilibacteria bacterium]|nr:hypothetical protein [Candidatus Gracilibacteria bacterium]NJS41543.1 hypothetical protein [Candidatus Gracilibacteria bacterium]
MFIGHYLQWFANEFPESAITALVVGIVLTAITLTLTKGLDGVISFVKDSRENKRMIDTQVIIEAINDSSKEGSIGFKLQELTNVVKNMNDPKVDGSLANQIAGGFARVDRRFDIFEDELKNHHNRISRLEVQMEERIPKQPYKSS